MMTIALRRDAEPTTMIRTKLVAPPHYGALITRDRLHHALDRVVRHKLALIAAPAGFGKTTLVSSWLAACDEQHAWVALDDGDNDPARFWRYVLTALGTFDQAATDAALRQMHAGPRPSFEGAIMTWLHAARDVVTHRVLVLDDYHVIDCPSIHSTMAMLLDHLPPTLHIILIGRSVPPFPLARMRAHGALLELGAADLRFNVGEIERFIACVAPQAGAAHLAASLDRRTEGWAVGLRVLALALNEQPHGTTMIDAQSSHRDIHDYLIEDVFAMQPPELQEFLLETSGLDHLSASLCDAVRQRDDSSAILALLERRNLFIMPLDAQRQWYRFHALFVEAMRREAAQRLPHEQIQQHASRASNWYRTHDMLEEAIGMALNACAYEDAAVLIEQICAANDPYFEHHSARRWIERLPREVVALHPELCLIHAQAVLFTVNRRSAEIRALVEAPLRLAEQYCEQVGDVHQRGAVYSLWALLLFWQGEYSTMAQYARRALPLLPQHDARWRGVCLTVIALDECAAGRLTSARQCALDARACSVRSRNRHNMYAATLLLADIHAEQGALTEASTFYHDIVDGLGPDAMGEQLAKRALALAGLAAIAYERDESAEAARLASDALALGQHLANEDVIVKASLVLVRVERGRGASSDARRLVRDLRMRTRRPDLIRAIDLLDARYALVDGNIAAARRWRTTYQHLASDVPQRMVLHEMLLGARLALAEGDTASAQALLHDCRARANEQGRAGVVVEASALLALCHDQNGQRDAAYEMLSAALQLAQFEAYRRIFIDDISLLPLLEGVAAASGTIAWAQFARDVRARLDGNDQEQHPSEPLTPQEQRVLDLLAAGHSNQEMAQMFVVSVNTIKTQVKSIYRKLNVSNRLQAANAVRQLSIR